MKPSRELETRRILVLGFGVTGRAVCQFAHRHALRSFVSERGTLTDEQRAWLHSHDISFEDGGHSHRLLTEVDAVIVSPGVPAGLPVIKEADRRGIPVVSEIDFALKLLDDPVVVAVTGTNGKSSTVEAIAAILRGFGRTARVTGNIGVPLISRIDEIERSDIVVLEMSSYQLEQSQAFRPRVGVVLNLSPDHIHRHGSLDAYTAAKGKLFAHQTSEDVAVLPSALAAQFDQGLGRRLFYDRAFAALPDGAAALFPHERDDLRAAMAACSVLLPEFAVERVPMDRVRAAFRLPHRMQTIGYVRGALAIDDSKSTNADSAVAALRSLEAPTVLLLGGRSKDAGYDRLADEIATSNVRRVLVFGEAAGSLHDVLASNPAVAPIVSSAPTMADAVVQAIHDVAPGDVILLSPACASFDAFVDFAERGDAFASMIRSHPTFTNTSPRT